MKKVLLLAIILVSTTSYAQRGSVIGTGRPSQAIGANVVGTSVFQVQSGVVVDETNNSDSSVLNNIIRYGLSDSVEVSGVIDYKDESDMDLNGLDNIQLGGRYNIFAKSEGLKPALCVQGRVRLKGSGDFKRNKNSGVFILSSVHKLTDRNSLNMNFGFSYSGSGGEPSYNYAINVSQSLSDKWGTFLEVFGNHYNDELSTNLDTGITYLLNNDTQLDFGVGIDVDEDYDNKYLTVGVSWRTF